MNKNFARMIYSIIFLTSGFGVLSTIFSIFYTPKPNARVPNKTQLSTERLETDISKLLSRNIFNTEGIFPDKPQIQSTGVQCMGTPTQSSLPYNVTGIIYGGNSKNSVVVLQNKNTEEVLILHENQKIPPKGSIYKIDPTRVWIQETGCPQYLDILKTRLPPSRVRKGSRNSNASDQSYSESGFERHGTNTDVTRQWVDDILENKLTSVLNDALVTPHMVDGRVNGFTILQIEPMSVYDKLGLKDGDVITSINGVQLNDAGRAIQTLNGLRNENQISLSVIRNGKPTSFKVNIR